MSCILIGFGMFTLNVPFSIYSNLWCNTKPKQKQNKKINIQINTISCVINHRIQYGRCTPFIDSGARTSKWWCDLTTCYLSRNATISRCWYVLILTYNTHTHTNFSLSIQIILFYSMHHNNVQCCLLYVGMDVQTKHTKSMWYLNRCDVLFIYLFIERISCFLFGFRVFFLVQFF